MNNNWTKKEAPFLGLTGMGGGVASLMWAGLPPEDTFEMWRVGENRFGILGQNQEGSPEGSYSRSSPVQVPGAWTNITRGQDQTTDGGGRDALATKDDGTLWSWGYNNNGQLGLNDKVSHSSPTQIGTGTGWGRNKGLINGNMGGVIKSDGSLWVWGLNSSGQLGLNDRTTRSSPTQVGTDTDWEKLGAAMSAMYSIKTNGELWAWGNGSQLGYGASANRSSPVQIPGTWSDIGSGYGAAAGVKTDGTLWSWGNDYQGLMGHNNRTPYSSPKQVGSGTDWKEVSISETTMGAVKTDGTLWMCGYDQNGNLGNNLDGTPGHRSSPIQVPGTTWAHVAVNTLQTIATKTDGSLWLWGNGEFGGMALNDRINRSSPIQVPGVTMDTDNLDLIDTGRYNSVWLKPTP